MFDVPLGIKIIRTEEENIIGISHLDSINESIRIDNPLGLKSTPIKKTDSGESFKLEMYTMSEFSSKSVIINSSRWKDILEPNSSISSEYKRISSEINKSPYIADYDDFKGIDMDDIMNNSPVEVSESKEILKDFFEEIIRDDVKKDDYIPRIRDRWVDKL